MNGIATTASKLRWRVHFLWDPEGFAARDPFFSARGDFPIRQLLLAAARSLSARERLEFINPFGPREHVEDFLLLKRLRRAPDGSDYFDLERCKIFFRPEHPIADEAELLQGILLILKETFVFPVEFLSEEVQIAPGDVVLDVGGNVGTSALLFSRLAGSDGRVYSFEPVFPGVLRRNLRENGIDNVRVIPQGVSDRPGAVEFAITSRGIDSRIASPSFGAGRPTVALDLTTLDRFVEEEGLDRVDYIKMDIEGAEELALRGARRVIERFRPRWSIASYHTDPTGEKQHPKLVRLLHEMGYTVREVERRHIYAW